MMRKIYLSLIVILFLSLCWLSVSAENQITVNITQEENMFTVSGETGPEREVTIMVTSPSGLICYVDQKTSNQNGLYSFVFILPYGMENGDYAVAVGVENQAVPYQTTVTYDDGLPLLLATIDGTHVTVWGNLRTGAGKEVTILVRKPGGSIAYVDQMTTDDFGMYRYEFILSPPAVNGVYTISVGGEGVITPYQTTVTYDDGAPLLCATIDGTNVTAWGNLRTGSGKEVTILVRKPGGSIAYVDQVTTDDFGMYRYEFILSPSAVNGIYTISVGGEDVITPYQTTVEYTEGLLPLSIHVNEENIIVEGNLQNGADKDMAFLVRNPLGNIVYVDQLQTDEHGAYRFVFVLPATSVSGFYTVTVGGEGIEIPAVGTFAYLGGVEANSKTMTLYDIKKGRERKFFIQGKNMKQLEYKIFILSYDPTKLKVDDLCLYTYEKEKNPGAISGTHFIVTNWDETAGIIQFKLNVTNGATKWNGTLGGILFTGMDNGNASVRLDIITER